MQLVVLCNGATISTRQVQVRVRFGYRRCAFAVTGSRSRPLKLDHLQPYLMGSPMPEVSHRLSNSDLAQIAPNDRLVVLARTLQANGSKAETVLRDDALN